MKEGDKSCKEAICGFTAGRMFRDRGGLEVILFLVETVSGGLCCGIIHSGFIIIR